MHFSIPVYQRKRGAYLEWTTVGLGPFTRSRSAMSPAKVGQLLLDDLKKAIATAPSREMVRVLPKRGTRLVRVRLDVGLASGAVRTRFTGQVPLILEERRFSGRGRVTIAYHPMRQDAWFPVADASLLSETAHIFFARSLSGASEAILESLTSDGKDMLRIVAFSASPKSLLDDLDAKEKGLWDDLMIDPARGQKKKPKVGLKLLPQLGVDVTAHLLGKPARPGLPRPPHGAQLESLVAGRKRQPVFVLGPSGVGKTMLIEQWAWDLAETEGYGAHRNADRITHLWRISGKRLIAGMSHVGDWEQRVIELLDEVRGKLIVLHIPDLFRFGRLGRARDSDRCLADLFRPAIARGDVALLGEGTSEQFAQLEEDAPSLAGLFVRLPLPEPTQSDAFRVLLSEARAIEGEKKLEIAPMALRALLELSRTFGGAGALPGRVLSLLRRVVDYTESAPRDESAPVQLGVAEVIGAMSAKLGLPRALLAKGAPLDRAEVERQLATQVLGQPDATRAAAELIVRIKANVVDPRRPYGVYLFTGPTGTGKTELARCIAEYLFGHQKRLVRFDMSEFSTSDAVARLVGDFVEPEGLLTRAVREEPLSVVLLDEIDKAHPSVHGLLLQLFEDARLTDAAGNTAPFENTVIIMTSNLGARQRQPIGWGVEADPILSDVARAVREFFSPELFNRIDRIVAFRPLAPETAIDVAEKELAKLKSRRGLEMRNTFLEVSRAVVERVAREALLARDGARSLKRYLEERIAVPVAEIVASDPGAEMRMLYVFESRDAERSFAIRDERMLEARPLDGVLELDRLGSASAADLQNELGLRVPALRELQSRARALVDEVPHAEGTARFWAELFRDAAEHWVQRCEYAAFGTKPIAWREEPSYEVKQFGRGRDFSASRYRLSSRGASGSGAPLSREGMLDIVARVEHLARIAPRVADPAEHGVILEIVRVASPKAQRFQDALGSPSGGRAAALLDWLVRAYVSFASELALGEGSARHRDAGFEGAAVVRSGNAAGVRGAEALERETTTRPDCVVLALSGLGLRDALEREAGTHVWQPIATSPEIVRVRVLPEGDPIAIARDFIKRASAFRRAMEHSGDEAGGVSSAPGNPAGLLPLVRRFRFEPPLREGKLAPIELEDFVLGMASEPPVRDPVEMIRRILWIRASRASVRKGSIS